MRVRVGVDTGGTFTDVVALDERSGRLVAVKTPSTPTDPSLGFMAGVRQALDRLGVGEAAVVAVSHGTTVATNQLLEGEVGRLGFVTTEGFEMILEIARQAVPDGYGNSYFWAKPPRIVPAHLVKTVSGRLDHLGREVRPFDEEGAVAVSRWFAARGIDTLGVCFLHSYANPAHEEAMRDVLAREHPGATVSISSEVLREYREYERSVTTLVDAAVKPAMARYLTAVQSLLDSFGAEVGGARSPVPFHVMRSNGGVLSAAEVVRRPISTVLSGPAAGALGAALVAGRAGHDRVVTLDGGGTSTDVAVVLGGEPMVSTEGRVGAYPCKVPMIDVVSVGAGGGSVAWVPAEGGLRVGPRSAGADPGPLCYGRGGTEPTVTDAHAVLGRLPSALLAGELPLDIESACQGLGKLAADLGLDRERVAAGILEISAWDQANALRQVTVMRGLDVRGLTLTAFGGSGPLLACRLADILHFPAVLVPVDPGSLSAFGLLTVDVRTDFVRTAVARHAELDLPRVASVYRDLEGQAARALEREGFPPDRRLYRRGADLRYFGQAFEVGVAAPGGEVGAAWAEQVASSFHDAHERLYGYGFRHDPRQAVEWVNLRVTGIGPIRRPSLAEQQPGGGNPERARTGTREVGFGGDRQATPVYWRPELAPGDRVPGPAVVEEYGSTVPIHPGYEALVDRHANLLVTRSGAPR
ncbi:MAG: hydantoinase/oxoprolinase family protein [Acidimicrobiales bacterium]